jgi:hypothetical protein
MTHELKNQWVVSFFVYKLNSLLQYYIPACTPICEYFFESNNKKGQVEGITSKVRGDLTLQSTPTS